MKHVRGIALAMLSTLVSSGARAAPVPAGNPVETAIAFLAALAQNTRFARPLATADAIIVIGDVGAPFADLAGVLRVRERRTFVGCRARDLNEVPLPGGARTYTRGMPDLRTGALAMVDGIYACTASNGEAVDWPARLVVKDGKIAAIYLRRADPSL